MASTRAAAPYVELRAHSAFSFGDGAVTPEMLVQRAAKLGYASLGLTDHGDLGGVIRFAMEAERQGIRPIVGTELLVDDRPAAFLARTAEGYRNIAALVTRARAGALDEAAREETDGDVVPLAAKDLLKRLPPRGRPCVTWGDVAQRSAGVHALTGPASGEIASQLRSGERRAAARTLARWREAFGEHLAVEVQLHQAGRREEALAGALITLAESEGVPWVVAGDPRYIDRPGRLAHDVLTALRAGITLREATEQGMLLPNGSWRLQSPAEMAARWVGREQGIETSVRIAGECDFALSWLRPPLPSFPVPPGQDIDGLLREKTYEGARERWGDQLSEKQRHQLDHELKMIADLGYSGFFLVMWDGVREARRRNILCQGRGSAANSAVAYCLGVTAVDPVKHGLLFERFLSPVRIDGLNEAPDIDVDVEHDRREEVLNYMYGRWRRESAAITCIVQTYAAPNAVLDVLRAHGHPPALAQALSKRVHGLSPSAGAERLAEGLAAAHGLDVTTPVGRTLLETIRAFDGLPRLRSTHPGGFVLSSARLGDYCPIEPTTMGRTILQFDKDDLDAVGIPKFDFLGLGALSMVRHAFDAIERRGRVRPEIYAVDQTDEETFKMISRGDTIGTFQIESRAQIASLVHTKPERMYDIVVQVALIRPGPIVANFVHPYTRRRRGQEAVTYPAGLDDKLGPVLDRTQGIPIFQEQAMALSMALAGYSATEADELRRTMGNDRKRPRLVAALERLRGKMLEKGIPEEAAAQITQDLESFANYGFPESHAWSFALIAYVTAWLKTHEPAAFYAGLLNAWPMGFYSPATLVHDAKRHALEVRGPCLSRGAVLCTIEETDDEHAPALRIGWKFVRGIGEKVLDRLAAARAAGPFTSIDDVVQRARLTRAETGALARAGAFDAWESDRRRAAWRGLRIAGDTLPLAPVSRDDATTAFAPRRLEAHEAIALDYRAVGLSTVGHPMERLRGWCRRMGVLDTTEVLKVRDRSMATIAGLVTVRQRPQTAKGTVFLLLEDELGSVNVIVSRTLDEQHQEVVRQSKFLAIHGRVEKNGPLVNVIAAKFKSLDELGGASELEHRSHDFR
jgi:error-prone DNA polymerase